MVDPVSPEVPPETPLHRADFGGQENALRKFEEHLESVERDLERGFEQRARNAATAQEARKAIATLTEQAHAADGTDPEAAKRHRARRQRKRAAYQEAHQALQQIESRCARLTHKRKELERNINQLAKFRSKARRRRLWDRLRGIRDVDDTGAGANAHIPPWAIALAVGGIVFTLLGAIGYQASPPPEPGKPPTGYVKTVLQFYGLMDEDPPFTAEETAAAAAKAWRPNTQPGARARQQAAATPPPPPIRKPPPPNLARVDLNLSPEARALVRSVEGYRVPAPVNGARMFADITTDGSPELLFRDWDGQRLLVYRRLGSEGGYAYSRDIPTGPWFTDMQAGDLDHDGDIDLVTACGSREILLLMNDGAGRFTRVLLKSRAWANHMRLVDINDDGHLDLVTTGNRTLVWLGNGDGSFRDSVRVDVSEGEGRLVVADFNDDGVLDVATVGEHRWQGRPTLARELRVTLLQADGQPLTETRVSTFDQPLWRIVAYDFDAANGMDLVALELSDATARPWGQEQIVSLLWNSGSGRFDRVQFGGTKSGNGLLVRDMDGDGRPDIVAGNAVFRREGRQLVLQPVRFSTRFAGGMFGPDVDGDGVADIAVWLRGDRLALYR